jgi:hypothetical protein
MVRAERLYGIKFWALHFNSKDAPRFQVLRYIGHSPNTDFHYFETLRGGVAVLSFSTSQIADGNISPFSLNTSYLEEMKVVA